jgi:hypothetical protein
MSLPVDFEAKIKQAPSKNGYPYQISASDLMQNFVYATTEFKPEEFDVTESKGESSQHTTRKVSLKNSLVGTDQGNIPSWDKNLNEGLGGWQMARPTDQGHFFYWNTNLNSSLGGWQMIPAPSKPGEFLFWDVELNANAGGWNLHDPSGEGTLVYFSNEAKKWQNFVPIDKSVIFYKEKKWESLVFPSGDDPVQLTAEGGELSWAPGIPELPSEGTHVLGSVEGVLTWISTEEC